MYNVLIADDHAIVRSGIAYLIDKQPTFQVVGQTANGTDTYMPPGESGLITAQRIHEHYPLVRMIILSMHEEQEYINKAIHNGAMSYVLKSSPDSEILRALTQVSNGENYIDENITLTKKDLSQINFDGVDVNLTGYNSLSKREREVFPLVALGYTNKEIAAKLFISTKTVEAHKANIVRKLKLETRADLVRYAIHHHLIDI